MKIVINTCYGGFGISEVAMRRYAELKGWDFVKNDRFYFYAQNPNQKIETIFPHDLERDDPLLVQVVEELGEDADGPSSSLSVVEIPAGTSYRIDEYDGMESVETRDTIDWKVAT